MPADRDPWGPRYRPLTTVRDLSGSRVDGLSSPMVSCHRAVLLMALLVASATGNDGGEYTRCIKAGACEMCLPVEKVPRPYRRRRRRDRSTTAAPP